MTTDTYATGTRYLMTDRDADRAAVAAGVRRGTLGAGSYSDRQVVRVDGRPLTDRESDRLYMLRYT